MEIRTMERLMGMDIHEGHSTAAITITREKDRSCGSTVSRNMKDGSSSLK